MNEALISFFILSEQDKRDVFEAVASRLGTLPAYVEKDFWVCFVLDALYNGLSGEHPKLLFKGGTSLSKAFGLIERFSEDIDLVIHRDGLGFEGDRDPVIARDLSNKRRSVLFRELTEACSGYILGDLKTALTRSINEMVEGCRVLPDDDDDNRQTLFIEYTTLYPSNDVSYVSPRVKIEAGARSALDPNLICAVNPYISDELPDWYFGVEGIRTLAPERTYWEKLLILHGLHYGYEGEERLPTDRDLISRHYYDVAMITATGTGRSALSSTELLDSVREHNLIAFRQAWKQFEKAVPGSLRLMPQPELRSVVERDYRAMQGMILGSVPDFEWIMEQLQQAESAINRA